MISGRTLKGEKSSIIVTHSETSCRRGLQVKVTHPFFSFFELTCPHIGGIPILVQRKNTKKAEQDYKLSLVCSFLHNSRRVLTIESSVLS